MKTIFQVVCIVAVISALTGCKGNVQSTENNRYTIVGSVEEMENEKIYLFKGDDIESPVDTAVVKNGRFRFEGKVDEPWCAVLESENKFISTRLIVESGNIVVNYDSVGGTPLNDKLYIFLKDFPFTIDNPELMRSYETKYYNARNAKERAEAERGIDSLYTVIHDKQLVSYWALYHENDDNILGVTAMEAIATMGEFTYSEFDSIVKAATPRVANSPRVQEKLEQLRRMDLTSAGKHYIDIQGDGCNLSDLIDGKLALVDFYASWCGPCRNEIKDNLVPLWNKYKGKGLVIVGLNVWERGDAATRKAAHEKVMSDLGITYPQLVDSTTNATETYGVLGIPEIILIDKDGTILARGLRGAAIEEAIIEALKN